MGMDDARFAVEVVTAGPEPERLATVLPWVATVPSEDREECALEIYSAAQCAAATGRPAQLQAALKRWHGD